MSGFSKHLVVSLLLLALAAGASADINVPTAGGKKQKGEALSPPPEAAPVDVRVRRGGSVEIPLQVFGVAGQPLLYHLLKPPRAGRLSEVRMISVGTGVVLYQHSGERTLSHDKFTFTAEVGGQTSAAANVNITIIDDPPALAVRDELDFGTVTIGSTVTKEITIENRGGGVLQGTASIDGPWKIDGKASYKLLAGEKQPLRLRFAPQTGQAAHGEIRYSSDPGRKTILDAVAEAAVGITPERLELQTGHGASRVGVLTITNRTSAEIPLRLRIGGKLKGPERVTLPGGATVSVTIQADPGETGSIEGAVQVESPSFVTDIDVHAPALGPVLHINNAALAFGNVDSRQAPTQSVRITNAGGTGTFVRVEASSRLVIATADSSFWLEAGASRDIAVSINSPEAGTYHEQLTIQSDGNGFVIPATAEIAHGRGGVVVVSPKGSPAPFQSLNFSTPIPKPAATLRVGIVQIRRVTDKSCVIAWRIPVNMLFHFKLEAQSTAPGVNGKRGWKPLKNVFLHDPRIRIATAAENLMAHGVNIESLDAARPQAEGTPFRPDIEVSAFIDQLEPATLYVIRIVGKDEDNTEVSLPFVVRTADPPLLTSGRLRLPALACLALVAGAISYRKRRAALKAERDKPAPEPVFIPYEMPGPSIRELAPGRYEILKSRPKRRRKTEPLI